MCWFLWKQVSSSNLGKSIILYTHLFENKRPNSDWINWIAPYILGAINSIAILHLMSVDLLDAVIWQPSWVHHDFITVLRHLTYTCRTRPSRIKTISESGTGIVPDSAARTSPAWEQQMPKNCASAALICWRGLWGPAQPIWPRHWDSAWGARWRILAYGPRGGPIPPDTLHVGAVISPLASRTVFSCCRFATFW